MGNIKSICRDVAVIDSKSATLIDFDATVRHIKLPMTVAELMLEHPGFFISPVEDIRRTLRFPAMKADDELLPGKKYMLVSTTRFNGKVSVSEMEVLESGCRKRKSTRRSAKVLPAATAVVAEEKEQECDTGLTGLRLENKWKPALEPIYEL